MVNGGAGFPLTRFERAQVAFRASDRGTPGRRNVLETAANAPASIQMSLHRTESPAIFPNRSALSLLLLLMVVLVLLSLWV